MVAIRFATTSYLGPCQNKKNIRECHQHPEHRPCTSRGAVKFYTIKNQQNALRKKRPIYVS